MSPSTSVQVASSGTPQIKRGAGTSQELDDAVVQNLGPSVVYFYKVFQEENHLSTLKEAMEAVEDYKFVDKMHATREKMTVLSHSWSSSLEKLPHPAVYFASLVLHQPHLTRLYKDEKLVSEDDKMPKNFYDDFFKSRVEVSWEDLFDGTSFKDLPRLHPEQKLRIPEGWTHEAMVSTMQWKVPELDEVVTIKFTRTSSSRSLEMVLIWRADPKPFSTLFGSLGGYHRNQYGASFGYMRPADTLLKSDRDQVAYWVPANSTHVVRNKATSDAQRAVNRLLRPEWCVPAWTTETGEESGNYSARFCQAVRA